MAARIGRSNDKLPSVCQFRELAKDVAQPSSSVPILGVVPDLSTVDTSRDIADSVVKEGRSTPAPRADGGVKGWKNGPELNGVPYTR